MHVIEEKKDCLQSIFTRLGTTRIRERDRETESIVSYRFIDPESCRSSSLSFGFLLYRRLVFTARLLGFHILDVLVNQHGPRRGTFVVIFQIGHFQTKVQKRRPLIQRDATVELFLVALFQKFQKRVQPIRITEFVRSSRRRRRGAVWQSSLQDHGQQRDDQILVQRPVRPDAIELKTKFVKVAEFRHVHEPGIQTGQYFGLQGFPRVHRHGVSVMLSRQTLPVLRRR
jgi:hypothetical protein